jgi:hypothetical protein
LLHHRFFVDKKLSFFQGVTKTLVFTVSVRLQKDLACLKFLLASKLENIHVSSVSKEVSVLKESLKIVKRNSKNKNKNLPCLRRFATETVNTCIFLRPTG